MKPGQAVGYSLILGYFAGVLSTLSPCIIPILPVIFGGAASESKNSAIALAFGIVFSFTLLTIIFSLFGALIPLDISQLRSPSALLLILIGINLLIPIYKIKLSIFDIISNFFNDALVKTRLVGISSQFVTGCLLGAVWLPCSGPTLGAASILAAQSEHFVEASAVILSFALGAVSPLIILGVFSKSLFNKKKDALHQYIQVLNVIFALALIFLGLSIVTNYDRIIEEKVAYYWPDFLIRLSLKF